MNIKDILGREIVQPVSIIERWMRLRKLFLVIKKMKGKIKGSIRLCDTCITHF